MTAGDDLVVGAPALSPLQVFQRFLRFGLLAWGGPAAQIGMLREDLVEQERWIDTTRFNRVLALYQALPGPEAHKLCVYFGSLAGGRIGGVMAGLGFMLPGLILMLLLSWVYVATDTVSPLVIAAFAGSQAAGEALIVRAVSRLGKHVLTNRWLWVIAGAAIIAEFLGAPFALILIGAALIGTLTAQQRFALAGLVAITVLAITIGLGVWPREPSTPNVKPISGAPPTELSLFGSGLRAGLLAFGGAYSAIPFVQRDAVERGGWMTSEQFLDGLAIAAVLPAPMVIFVTFVGFLGAGLPGALSMTAGMFFPSFLFPLVGHAPMERFVERRSVHAALDGVAAAVVGLIAGAALQLILATLIDPLRLLIFSAALFAAFRLNARWSAILIIAGAALLGAILLR